MAQTAADAGDSNSPRASAGIAGRLHRERGSSRSGHGRRAEGSCHARAQSANAQAYRAGEAIHCADRHRVTSRASSAHGAAGGRNGNRKVRRAAHWIYYELDGGGVAESAAGPGDRKRVGAGRRGCAGAH